MQNFNERHDRLRWGCTTQMKSSEPGSVKKGSVEVTQRDWAKADGSLKNGCSLASNSSVWAERGGYKIRDWHGTMIAPPQLLKAPYWEGFWDCKWARLERLLWLINDAHGEQLRGVENICHGFAFPNAGLGLVLLYQKALCISASLHMGEWNLWTRQGHPPVPRWFFPPASSLQGLLTQWCLPGVRKDSWELGFQLKSWSPIYLSELPAAYTSVTITPSLAPELSCRALDYKSVKPCAFYLP